MCDGRRLKRLALAKPWQLIFELNCLSQQLSSAQLLLVFLRIQGRES